MSAFQPIPILTYHQIAKAPPKGAPFRSLYVDPSAFARQMAWLRMLGYRGLSMGALMPYLRGERVGKVVGITFDDGYLNNLTHAAPVLVRNGFSATCYVVSQRVGQTNLWDQSLGIAQAPLMDISHLQQWAQAGLEIGAHTRNHVRLTQTDAVECAQEIAQARADLEAMVGNPVHHFCYPYGDFDSSHVQMVRTAGYASATTTRRGRTFLHHDICQLPRVPVLRTTTLAALWLKVGTAYEDRRAS